MRTMILIQRMSERLVVHWLRKSFIISHLQPTGGGNFLTSPLDPNTKKKHFLLHDHLATTPCWSLAALLGVLPTTIGNFFEKNALRLRMDKGENDFNIWYENFDCGDVAEGLDAKEDNPVDACVDMIIKLHELNLL